MSSNTRDRQKVIIAGGGTAGWMCAAAMGKLLVPLGVDVTLVESDAIGTVGVGEATLPHLRFFNERLGINERDLMAETQATIKLGIEFRDWGRIGDHYIHPFGEYGREIRGIEFHHYWLKLQQQQQAGRICDWSLPVVMAEAGKFGFPANNDDSLMASFSYAYQFDATLYAQFLRRFAEAAGVKRVEGRITDVGRHSETGDVAALTLEDGSELEADLFVDCTGFRALLIEQTLKAGFEDWSDVLPCNRAVAVPCESNGPPLPYTRATARSAGWQWRIPLQHRIGNGYVYCSDYLSPEEAETTLLSNLDGAPTRDPLHLRFKTGKRRQQWAGNVVSVGLSSGFLEPLESTSIYLIQAAITNLIELFPAGKVDEKDRAEFNRVMDLEYERVRDFLVLHYCATERDDSPFWDYVRNMTLPDSFLYKMKLFKERGTVVEYKDGLFLHPSWIAVYLGQRVLPERYDARVDMLDDDKLASSLNTLKAQMKATVDALPDHASFLKSYSPAGPV